MTGYVVFIALWLATCWALLRYWVAPRQLVRSGAPGFLPTLSTVDPEEVDERHRRRVAHRLDELAAAGVQLDAVVVGRMPDGTPLFISWTGGLPDGSAEAEVTLYQPTMPRLAGGQKFGIGLTSEHGPLRAITLAFSTEPLRPTGWLWRELPADTPLPALLSVHRARLADDGRAWTRGALRGTAAFEAEHAEVLAWARMAGLVDAHDAFTPTAARQFVGRHLPPSSWLRRRRLRRRARAVA